jgi:hypothetical protein
MASTVSASNRLRKTYNPVNVASVRRFDEARAKGAKCHGTGLRETSRTSEAR